MILKDLIVTKVKENMALLPYDLVAAIANITLAFAVYYTFLLMKILF
jgi:hypothetical protein